MKITTAIRSLALVFCVVVPITAWAAEIGEGYRVTYDGGSIAGAKSG